MDWSELSRRLTECTGADGEVDAAIAESFAIPADHYTGSVESCRALVASVLPGWRLHLGFNVTGVFPYASLTRDKVHLEAEAAALPLAILKVAIAAFTRPPEAPDPGR